MNAHEGVHEQIASISGEILMDRGDADLFLRRGELERIGRQWSDAERDFTVAEVLDPSLTVVHLARGRMELDRGNYGRARDQLSSYLASSPRSVPALIARAEAHASLHRAAEAIKDYRSAIEFSGQPEPDWYLRLSRLQAEDRGRAQAQRCRFWIRAFSGWGPRSPSKSLRSISIWRVDEWIRRWTA